MEQRDREHRAIIESLQTTVQELLYAAGKIQVRVPPGYSPGQELRVQLPDQQIVAVTVPPGAKVSYRVKCAL
eukprot:SAG31_NODE_22804_length_517_cov_1.200957_1_plen_71_part_01